MTTRRIGMGAIAGLAASLGQHGVAGAQTITALSPLPYVTSRAFTLNSDGSRVAGAGIWVNSVPYAMIWDNGTGFDFSCGPTSTIYATSPNGLTFAGMSSFGGSANTPARWVWAGCPTSLGAAAGLVSSAGRGISADGQKVVGENVFFNGLVGNYARPWVWTPGSGMVNLSIPLIYGAAGYANGISTNGQVIVGAAGATSYTSLDTEAVYWDGTGMHPMGMIPPTGSFTFATATNSDGSVIVGYGDLAPVGIIFPSHGLNHAWRWTGGTYTDLGVLAPNGQTFARGVSQDGSVVVGESTVGSTMRAWIWRGDFGLAQLDVFLPTIGVNTTGWTFLECNGISADSTAICGTGIYNTVQQAYVIRGLPALCGPIITLQPSATTVCRGDNACLFTTGYFPGFRRPDMQWRRRGGHNTAFPVSNGETGNGSYVTGANDDYFCFNNAQPGDSGLYDCVITAGCATVITQSVQLTVLTGPQMLVPVQLSQQVCSHGTATLSTTVVPGTAGGPLTYQWNKNNVPLSDGASCGSTISGSNTSTLTITNCAGIDTGTYGVTVTGPCGFLGSAGQVTVCVADVDDGSNTGTCDGGVTIDDVLYFLYLVEVGDPAADIDDGSATGTPDCGVTIDDLLYYLYLFENGC